MNDVKRDGGKLIFALDVECFDDAVKWVVMLKEYVKLFKVGKQLFTACGPDIVREIVRNDCNVFLDLKFHDIPNTVASASMEAAKLGASIITVHASGGRRMIEDSRKALNLMKEKGMKEIPLIAAVTVLTSISDEDLSDIGCVSAPREQVLRLARLAVESGADAIVCSPLEISFLRDSLGDGFKIITPGIRKGNAGDDQKRVMSARNAVEAGADFIVVGRPIRNAVDPVKEARKIAEEISAVSSFQQ